MVYTIKQAAEKLNLTAYTLRFYDKEGLLPFVARDSAGNRVFTESSLEWLSLICCLKNSGMPIKQIRKYIDCCMRGDETLEARRQILLAHRAEVLRQISALEHNLEKINYKIEHYSTLCNVYLPAAEPEEEAIPLPPVYSVTR